MSKKLSFPEPGCWTCSDYYVAGQFPTETLYCKAKGRTGRRFRASDPTTKPPKWCPKRLNQKVLRVFRLRGEEEEMLELMRAKGKDPFTLNQYAAMPHRYAPEPVLEIPTPLTAKQLYEQARDTGIDEILGDFRVEFGDIVEVDDGLKPYDFFCFAANTILPAYGFQLPNPQLRKGVRECKMRKN